MSFLSEAGVCEHCGVSDCFHDRDHLVIECYPKQIDALRQRVADLTRALEYAREYRAAEQDGTPRMFRGKKLHDLGAALDSALAALASSKGEK